MCPDRFEKMSEKARVRTVGFAAMSVEHSFLLLPFLPAFKWLSMQTNCFSDNSQWAQILLLLFTNVFMKAQAILAITAIFYSLRCIFLVLVVATI